MKLSNDVEKYEIEVTKMGQSYSFFLTVNLQLIQLLQWALIAKMLATLTHLDVVRECMQKQEA